VLRLARTLDAADGDRFAAARRFVIGLTGPTGGVATYEPVAAGQLAEFLRMEGSYAGWCGTHTCVTAAAAVLDLDPRMPEFLVQAQRPDGSWAGHWWDDDEYTTARAIEALVPDVDHADAVMRATAWAAARISDNGAVRSVAHGGDSPFATALALQAVVGGQRHDGARDGAAARATQWLVANQRADGSWAPSARLRVPAPAVIDPLDSPETTLTYIDDDAVFTTATVLAALSAAAAWPSSASTT
ncbi:MAG TPA: prenyltransferase/squalene oxidase repeat-containing protein, partial [Acidimicrobiales bacterium]|nr:prenyltransferase/squalene oxidase repeat-containing protein [Acidimicrobiales bacterium]